MTQIEVIQTKLLFFIAGQLAVLCHSTLTEKEQRELLRQLTALEGEVSAILNPGG